MARVGLAILLLIGTTAFAQDQSAPQRRVARLSISSGDVSVQRGDSESRSAGAVNAPLTTGDVVAAGQGGRAEVQFDSANMVRLDGNSEIRLADVSPAKYQIQVGRGTVIFSQVRDSRAEIEIDTPQVAIRPKQKGAYRITVYDDHAEITVRVGQAEIYTPNGSEALDPGKTMMVRGDPSDPEFQMENAIDQDDFDHWNAGRDQQMNRSTSSRRVNPDIYGTEDLDDSGRWVNTPDYGTVWTPTEGPDWAPYREGQWAWDEYYGWTWVSYEPWGWAPYHYGRWFFRVGIGWCWYPGPVFVPTFWSPALVAFFGVGGGFGWVPLGPFEAVHRWWGPGVYGGIGYRGAVMAHNNIYTSYRNARITGAVTAVSAHDFANGRFSSMMHVTPAQLRTASLVKGQVPVSPTATSMRFSNRAVSTPVRATNFSSTHFAAHNQPPATSRASLVQAQRSFGQTGSRAGMTGAPGASSSNGAWRRFGSAPSSTARNSSTPSPYNGSRSSGASRPGSSSSGWQRFPSSGGSTATGSRPYGGPSYGGQRSLQIAPPMVRERSSPAQSSRSSGSAPTSARSSGSSGASAPRSSGGGGGGHSGGGGGHGH